MTNFILDDKKIRQIYTTNQKSLDKTVEHVVQLLKNKNAVIATAESCTGGLLSQLITSVPGASNVFELGICTYSEHMKTQILNVPEDTIRTYGVVSSEVAAAMLRGLHAVSQADICLSVTGIAGPDGGTLEQPVGTVYAGVLFKDQIYIAHLKLWEFGLTTRESIRNGTAICIFGMTEHFLMEESTCRMKENPKP